MADDTKVAVLGTGIMGSAMAHNLLSAGVEVRAWNRSRRTALSGSAHGFRTGRINIYQALLSKPDLGESGLPLTRADWYA